MPTIKLLRETKPKQKKIDTVKAQERKKIYQKRLWRRLSAIKRADSPLCEDCLKAGRVEEAVDIHHRISFMTTDDPLERERLAFDYDNLISLCKTCHQRRHNQNGETTHEADA